MKLGGKVMVVTGAGSGIGRELVIALLERGARVAAVDVSEAGLKALADELAAGDRLSTHVLDVSTREAVLALPEAVLQAHGCVDGVINNAGVIHPFVPFADLSFEIIDRMIQVNLYGVINMCKAFLPHLAQRPEAHLVNVSSMGGFFAFPGQTMYGVAKAGVKLLTEGLYAELLDSSISVSVVLPGAVATNIAQNSGVQMARGLGPDSPVAAALTTSPAKTAATILRGVEANRLHILVGKDAKAMSLLSKVAPKLTTRFVKRQMQDLLFPPTSEDYCYEIAVADGLAQTLEF